MPSNLICAHPAKHELECWETNKGKKVTGTIKVENVRVTYLTCKLCEVTWRGDAPAPRVVLGTLE